MASIENQEEFVNEENCSVGGCEGGKCDVMDKQSLSTKDSQKDISDNREEEHTSENNVRRKDSLDGRPIHLTTEDFIEDAHHTPLPLSLGCNTKSFDNVNQEKGFDEIEKPQQGTLNDNVALSTSLVATVSAEKSESENVESTTTSHVKNSYTSQVMTVMLLGWMSSSVGAGITFPGAVLPQFTNPDGDDDVYLEPHTLSLFVSISNIASVAGYLVIGQLLVPLGPRVIMLVGLPLAMASWLGLVFFSQTWIIMMCRVVSGFSYGLVKQPAVMYIVEVANENIRGRLVGVLCISLEIGYLSSYFLNVFMLTWRQLSLVYACMIVPGFIGLYFLPSSPRWLVNHGRVDQARKSLVFFRGRHYDVERELSEIVRQADEVGSSSSTCQQFKLILRPGIRKMFLVLFTIFTVFPFQGIPVINSYLILILSTPGTPIDPSLGSTLCSIFKIVGGIVHSIIIDYFGRVPIMVVSVSFISVCTFSYAYYIHPQGNLDSDTFSWIPIASMVALQFFIGVANPIIDLLQGELLPNACRAVSMPILSIMYRLSYFTVVQLYLQMEDIFGNHGVFGFFTAVNLALGLFFILAVPETKGMSLEAISDANHHPKKKNNEKEEVDMSV